MPDGVVQWVDPSTGDGVIMHSGRRYPVETKAMEPVARHAGVRVHFDVERRGGVPFAVHVELREGSRVSHRQGRFGDLSGAHRPDSRAVWPDDRFDPGVSHQRQRQPLRVARRWAELMADGAVEDAVLLYAPAAALHVEGDVVVGGDRIRTYLERSPLVEAPLPESVTATDGLIVLRWSEPEPVEVQLRVLHGEIVEQWQGAVWVGEIGEPAVPAVILTSGDVGSGIRAYATENIGKVLREVGEPILYARIRLGRAGDPARQRPAFASATVDVNGRPVRVHVAAGTMPEAVDLLEAHLRDRLGHVAAHERALRRRGEENAPGEWRHGDVATRRPPYFPRPPEERRLVRHKTFAIDDATVDEAVYDLETMDYDFYLFRDLATGQDSVVFRTADGPHGLVSLDGPGDADVAAAGEVRVEAHGEPTLTVAEALARLDAGQEPWVFFRDAVTRRGHVVYRRYDGHYGLIAPADETVPPS